MSYRRFDFSKAATVQTAGTTPAEVVAVPKTVAGACYGSATVSQTVADRSDEVATVLTPETGRQARFRQTVADVASVAGGNPQLRFSTEAEKAGSDGPISSDLADFLGFKHPQWDDVLSSENRGSAYTPATLATSATVVPPTWAADFARLDPNRAPVGIRPRYWREAITDGAQFLSAWASPAHELGWTAIDLFGVHERAPIANWSAAGLILCIGGGRVVALTTSTASIQRTNGARLTYTRSPPHADAVPLWDLPLMKGHHLPAGGAPT